MYRREKFAAYGRPSRFQVPSSLRYLVLLVLSSVFVSHVLRYATKLHHPQSIQPAKPRVRQPEGSAVLIDESEDCRVPRPLAPCSLPPEDDKIHVVLVSAMWTREANTQAETESMVKSIIFGTRCPLHIHFLVSGQPEIGEISQMMRQTAALEAPPLPFDLPVTQRRGGVGRVFGYSASMSTQQYDAAQLVFSLHIIPEEWVLEKAKAIGMFPLRHHASVPGMSKFFMADILWQVRRAVYLDVDMLFAGDIADMWAYFRGEMATDVSILYYMSQNHPETLFRTDLVRKPWCSCEMVLHLERMRHFNMTKLFMDELDGRKPIRLKDFTDDGDQFLFMWTCKHTGSRICRILPPMWNVSGCSKHAPFLGLSARGKELNGSCWRVVHFNCLGHARGGNGSYVVPEGWQEAIDWVKGLEFKDYHVEAQST